MDDLQFSYELATKIAEANGRAYYVGGYVRDKLLGINQNNVDIDIEVHGISVENLENILNTFGEVRMIGKSFGVYGVKDYHVDIALPRKETKLGEKHTDFRIDVDPYIGVEGACSRRDFTINAMMMDVLTNEIIDPCHGQDDLKNRIIRHVNDEKFKEDALRVFRGAQFAARFEFQIDPSTIELCKTIDTSYLSSERIEDELKKALLKADKPSIFFETLREMNQLNVWFPELIKLIDLPQNPVYHPEGDVWNHTMLVLDAAVQYRNLCQNPYYFMMAALCHDLGKIEATEFVKGAYHAYGHEIKGLPIATTFLSRFSKEKQLKRYVLNMMKLHMKPHVLYRNQSKYKTTNKMFDDSVDPQELIYLSNCDNMGKERGQSEAMQFLQARLKHYETIMQKDYVKGQDLINAGLKPDVKFNELLQHAHKLRLAEVDKDSVLKEVLKYAKKMKGK